MLTSSCWLLTDDFDWTEGIWSPFNVRSRVKVTVILQWSADKCLEGINRMWMDVL